MRVIEIAKRAGIGAHAVRFYVRAGLVVPRRNPSNNYKQFGEDDVARLRFIKGVQGLGFSLAEISALLGRLDAGECECNAIYQKLTGKMREILERMEELGRRYELMQKVHERWSKTMGNENDVGALCRFLQEQTINWPGTDVKLSGTPRARKPQSWAGSRRKTSPGLSSFSSDEEKHRALGPRIEHLPSARWTAPQPERLSRDSVGGVVARSECSCTGIASGGPCQSGCRTGR